MDSSTRARETTADAESGVDGGIFLTLATRRLDRSIDAHDRWTTRIANPRAMMHRDGAEDDDDSMIRARVVSTRRRWTRARTTTVTTMCACAFFAGVARGIGTGTPRAPAWSGGLARCAGGESSATTTNARGDVVAVGDGACASGGRGVTFRSRGERLVSTATASVNAPPPPPPNRASRDRS